MTERNPDDVTLHTLHQDLTGVRADLTAGFAEMRSGFTDLKGEIRSGFAGMKATLIAGFRSLPTRESSEEMVRLLQERNRLRLDALIKGRRGTPSARAGVVLGHERSRHDDVEPRLGATLGDPLARPVDFAAPHGRACSETRSRVWRARRARCFRNTSPSLASISRRRSRSANSLSAVRTRAE